MIKTKPILVTGAPRSGTTWVGRILGAGPWMRYVHEPFNISRRPCHCGVHFQYWFYHLPVDKSHEFKNHLEHVIYPSCSLIGLQNIISETAASKRIRPLAGHFLSFAARRVIVKDPIAVFSAETLAHMFEMDVVVLIRHPAAVVNSYKTLEWTHPFSHFTEQTNLIDTHLSPYRHEIENFTNNEYDIVDQAALLWKLIHHRIVEYQKTHPQWLFIRHEDLAREPVREYLKIFNHLKIPYSKHTYNAIQAHSLRVQPVNMDLYTTKRNSRQVTTKWKKRLTAAEVTRIRNRVESVATHFYSEDEW